GTNARYESEHKAERARLRHNAAAAAGRPAGGQRPFGYDVAPRTMINGRSRDTFEWTVNEYEADLIRDASRRVLEDGASLRSIVFARPRPDGTRSYICAEKVAGHQQKIMAGPLEDLVRDGVIEALISPMVHDAIGQEVEQGEDRRALAAELRSIEQRLLNAEH